MRTAYAGMPETGKVLCVTQKLKDGVPFLREKYLVLLFFNAMMRHVVSCDQSLDALCLCFFGLFCM